MRVSARLAGSGYADAATIGATRLRVTVVVRVVDARLAFRTRKACDAAAERGPRLLDADTAAISAARLRIAAVIRVVGTGLPGRALNPGDTSTEYGLRLGCPGATGYTATNHHTRSRPTNRLQQFHRTLPPRCLRAPRPTQPAHRYVSPRSPAEITPPRLTLRTTGRAWLTVRAWPLSVSAGATDAMSRQQQEAHRVPPQTSESLRMRSDSENAALMGNLRSKFGGLARGSRASKNHFACEVIFELRKDDAGRAQERDPRLGRVV